MKDEYVHHCEKCEMRPAQTEVTTGETTWDLCHPCAEKWIKTFPASEVSK